jgi:hypothetical protein
MKVVLIDHLKSRDSARGLGRLFRRNLISEYGCSEGVVREYRKKDQLIPDYKLFRKGKLFGTPVKVKFSYDAICDLISENDM